MEICSIQQIEQVSFFITARGDISKPLFVQSSYTDKIDCTIFFVLSL